MYNTYIKICMGGDCIRHKYALRCVRFDTIEIMHAHVLLHTLLDTSDTLHPWAAHLFYTTLYTVDSSRRFRRIPQLDRAAC